MSINPDTPEVSNPLQPHDLANHGVAGGSRTTGSEQTIKQILGLQGVGLFLPPATPRFGKSCGCRGFANHRLGANARANPRVAGGRSSPTPCNPTIWQIMGLQGVSFFLPWVCVVAPCCQWCLFPYPLQPHDFSNHGVPGGRVSPTPCNPTIFQIMGLRGVREPPPRNE